MTHLVQLLWAPCLAGFILSGIHTYLGVQVIERGAVFGSLSLVQLAALGAAIGTQLGQSQWAWSLVFAVCGAALLASARSRDAMTAVIYAVAAAAAVIAMSKSAGSAEHLKDMLLGSILSVSRKSLLITGGVYTAIGLLQFASRRRATKTRDFLFFASVGVVLALSFSIVGLLLAFTYLIAPAAASMLFTRSMGKRLAIGWTTGALVTLAGILVSLWRDLPASATIICTFGVALALMTITPRGLDHGV